jgi:phosphoglycerate dehydrogenase-like enzyme
MSGTVLFCTDMLWEDRRHQILALDPAIEVVTLSGDERVAAPDLERITTAFFSPDVWPHRVRPFVGACRRAPNLEWFHTSFAGTDDPMFGALRAQGVTVTNSAGAAAPSIAQTVMLFLLGLSRDVPRLARAQRAREWDQRQSIDVAGLKLGIVGLGAIGREVARLAAAFEMEAIGTRRRIDGDEPCRVWTDDRLAELLAWADAIVVTAPLTNATRGLIDAEALATMRPGSWFVNVGRGEIVDEPALIEALSSGHIAGAGLDVFAVEPLPPESPLWTMENVMIMPHVSGETERTNLRAIDIFLDNLGRHVRGEQLRNITVEDLSR